MRQSRSVFWTLLGAILFIGTAYASSSNETGHRVLEIISGEDQLPIVSQPTALKRIPLSLSETHGSVVKLLAPDHHDKSNAVSEPDMGLNLLDMDELWVTYLATPGFQNCIFSSNIRAIGSPLSASQSELLPDFPLYVSSGGQKKQGDKIILNGKVLPRDVNYLIRRQIGMYDNTGWRMVDKGKSIIFMHLMRMDMHQISSLEFDMDSTVMGVNFRLSRKASGKPTHTLEWRDIPKNIVEYGSTRRVRLDLASVIEQNIPGALEGDLPLNLIEILVFIDNDSIANDVVPIKRLDSYYDTPGSTSVNSGLRVLSYSELIGPNLWRWRMPWTSLHKLPLHKAVFTDGQITLDKRECVAAFKYAELVSLPPQVMLDAKPSTQNSISTLQNTPLPTDIAANLYLQRLSLAVFVAFSAWGLFLWRRGTVQRNVLVLWNSTVRFNERLSCSWHVLEKLIGNFFISKRQVLNLIFLLVVLSYWLFIEGKSSILNSSLDVKSIGLFIFSAFVGFHAWRWHVQVVLRNQADIKASWIVGEGKWPPLMVWVLTGAILVIIIVVQWQAQTSTAYNQKYLANLAASNVSSVLEMLILRQVLTLIEQGFYLPVLLALGYGFLPWLWRWAYWLLFFGARNGFALGNSAARLNNARFARFARWALVVLLLYGVGLKHIGQYGENYFFTMGGMAVVITWNVWMKLTQSRHELHWPALAEKIYGNAGGIYFSGALVGLVIAAMLSIIHLELIAEKVAVVVYYCLVVGTVFKIVALQRANRGQIDTPPTINDQLP